MLAFLRQQIEKLASYFGILLPFMNTKLCANFFWGGPKNAKKMYEHNCYTYINLLTIKKFGFHHIFFRKNLNMMYTGCPIIDVGHKPRFLLK